MNHPKNKLLRLLAYAQGCFYAAGGIWSLVSRRTFEMVTGPKVDYWLVNTVGILILTISAALLSAGFRKRISPETVLLGAGSAAGLAAIDIVYVSRKRISPVYLLDALAELILVLGWIIGWRSAKRD